ncbi:hypothetical protein [Thiomonas intermedia]|uniref:hypothetical protein n=1 Tax=Thiomonas intermedia TaxID=926 RepID=UPI0009A4F747|nr:hypothetical protein [Thiomonas intermedia]
MAYTLGQADLNGDGRPDLIVWYQVSDFCGSTGCSGVIVLATPSGYSSQSIGLPNFQGNLTVLPSQHHGMHDLQFDDSPVWQWSGSDYAIAKADLPGANAPAWTTRQSPGRPLMAVATPINSSIAKLLMFCEQGTPLLAMLTQTPLPSGPLTLTFGFRGWTVNVPMWQNANDPKLWIANVAGSDLPLWLAHRGRTATTDKLARLADASYLRIDGSLQGQISLADSARSTQAALSPCYRY